MINNSISKAIRHGEQTLNSAGANSQTANLDAMVLLSYVLVKPKSYLLTWPDELLNVGQTAMYETLLQRRSKGEPIAYITGQKEFFSLMFKVTSETLVPRPETEILVETVLDKFKTHKNDDVHILDLGTGTGAIAISLAKTRPNWQVTAVDKSINALNVAKENAKLHNVSNIHFVQSHWLQSIEPNTKYDVILSNPPYIAANDQHLLTDIKFEPRSALVAEKNGLEDLEEILMSSKKHLTDNGYLIIEHGSTQLDGIKEIVSKSDVWTQDDLVSICDYAGLPRFVLLKSRV